MARNDLILTNGTTLVVYPGLETMSDVDRFAKKLAAAGIPLLICLECACGTQVTSTTMIYRRHIQNTVRQTFELERGRDDWFRPTVMAILDESDISARASDEP